MSSSSRPTTALFCQPAGAPVRPATTRPGRSGCTGASGRLGWRRPTVECTGSASTSAAGSSTTWTATGRTPRRRARPRPGGTAGGRLLAAGRGAQHGEVGDHRDVQEHLQRPHPRGDDERAHQGQHARARPARPACGAARRARRPAARRSRAAARGRWRPARCPRARPGRRPAAAAAYGRSRSPPVASARRRGSPPSGTSTTNQRTTRAASRTPDPIENTTRHTSHLPRQVMQVAGAIAGGARCVAGVLCDWSAAGRRVDSATGEDRSVPCYARPRTRWQAGQPPKRAASGPRRHRGGPRRAARRCRWSRQSPSMSR